jgi:hypothetical protein
VSLSSDPAFSELKDSFVCGYKDITNESYSGISGRHDTFGNAVATTNGAGPHNIQMFVLSPDGTVLTCMPGYWNPQDMVTELAFAQRLNEVWTNPSLSRAEKNQMFYQMHMGHIGEHSMAMERRSRMQGFDQKYEAKFRMATSDTIKNASLISDPMAKMLPQQAFKTTDEIMHERMAKRPFVAYQNFDVAAFADYGRPKYDKHEDYRDSSGRVAGMPPKDDPSNVLGNIDHARKMQRRDKMAAMGRISNIPMSGQSNYIQQQPQQQYSRNDYVKTYGSTAGRVARRALNQGLLRALR